MTGSFRVVRYASLSTSWRAEKCLRYCATARLGMHCHGQKICREAGLRPLLPGGGIPPRRAFPPGGRGGERDKEACSALVLRTAIAPPLGGRPPLVRRARRLGNGRRTTAVLHEGVFSCIACLWHRFCLRLYGMSGCSHSSSQAKIPHGATCRVLQQWLLARLVWWHLVESRVTHLRWMCPRCCQNVVISHAQAQSQGKGAGVV